MYLVQTYMTKKKQKTKTRHIENTLILPAISRTHFWLFFHLLNNIMNFFFSFFPCYRLFFLYHFLNSRFFIFSFFGESLFFLINGGITNLSLCVMKKYSIFHFPLINQGIISFWYFCLSQIKNDFFFDFFWLFFFLSSFSSFRFSCALYPFSHRIYMNISLTPFSLFSFFHLLFLSLSSK